MLDAFNGKIDFESISKILKEKVNIIGSGRTDSGVHALEQSAHFDTNTKINDSYKFLKSVNSSLIVIKSAKAWHGCSKSVSAFIIGFEDQVAYSSKSV